MAVSAASRWQNRIGLSRSGVVPVVEQRPGRRGDVRVAAPAPELDLRADLVDLAVLSNAVEGPLGHQLELAAGLLPGPRDRHEVGAATPSLGDLVGDAVLVEDEMPLGLQVWRVDDLVLDDAIWHGSSTPGRGLVRCLGVPEEGLKQLQGSAEPGADMAVDQAPPQPGSAPCGTRHDSNLAPVRIGA